MMRAGRWSRTLEGQRPGIERRSEEQDARLSPRQRTFYHHARTLLCLRERAEHHGLYVLQQHPAGARTTAGRLPRIPEERGLPRGGLRELGERVSPDGLLRGANRLSLPEGFGG